MDVKGAAVLYTTATLAITFVGFAALLLIVRQSAGGALSALDRFLARTVVGHFFWIAAGALVAMLAVALANLRHPEVLYATALLVNLIIHAFAFVIALEVILRQQPGEQKRHS